MQLRPRPPVLPTPAVRLPNVQTRTLACGLELQFVALPDRRLTTARLILPLGAIHEPQSLRGLTETTLGTMCRGSASHPGSELASAFDRLGGGVSYDTEWNDSHLTTSVLVDRLPEALSLLFETVAAPTLTAADVTTVRAAAIGRALEADADPDARAERALRETIYHPAAAYSIGIPGERHTLETIGPDDVRMLHARMLTAAGARLFVAGDLDLDELCQTVEGIAAHHGYPRCGAAPVAPVADVDRLRDEVERQILIDRPGSAQSFLLMGQPGRSRRDPTYTAANMLDLVAMGKGQPYLASMRDEYSYTYGADCRYEGRAARGPQVIEAPVDGAITAEALAVMQDIIERLGHEPIEQAALDVAKSLAAGMISEMLEQSSSVVAVMTRWLSIGLTTADLERLLLDIEALTVEDLEAVAHEDFHTERMVTIVVGDASVIADPLEFAFGPFVRA